MKASEHINFLLISSFLMQMLIGIVGISVPIYAADMDVTPLLLGVIGATGGLIYSFMPFVSGSLSDRFRRKIFISASTLLYGLSCIFYALAENPYMFIPIKALEWISVALFWPSIEALLTEAGGSELKGILRKFNLSWGSAMIVGPMIGGSLISALGIGIRVPFLLSSIISFTLSFLSIVMIWEPSINKGAYGNEISKRSLSKIKDKDDVNLIFMSVVSILLFASVGGIVISLFPAYAAELGIPAYEIGLIILVNGLFRLTAFFGAYKIERRIGKAYVFLAGSLTLSLASALIVVSSTTPAFSISLSLLGFGTGILYAASIEVILKSWGSAKGYAAGIFESLIGAGYFLGPLAGGFVAEYFQSAPYILCSLISLAVSLLQTLYRMGKKKL